MMLEIKWFCLKGYHLRSMAHIKNCLRHPLVKSSRLGIQAYISMMRKNICNPPEKAEKCKSLCHRIAHLDLIHNELGTGFPSASKKMACSIWHFSSVLSFLTLQLARHCAPNPAREAGPTLFTRRMPQAASPARAKSQQAAIQKPGTSNQWLSSKRNCKHPSASSQQ